MSRAVHINPFSGKCIHGSDGARIQSGVLVNPKCEMCKLNGKG